MAGSVFSGPSIIHGQMQTAGAGSFAVPDYNEVAGPSIFYQGDGFPDVRLPLNKDNILPGSIQSIYSHPKVCLVDAVPQTLSATNILNAAAVAGAGPITLTAGVATSSKAICNAVPLVPWGASAPVSVIALDLGMTTVNVNATTTVTITAGDAEFFPVGGWIWIGGTGGGAGTFTRVTANAGLSTTTTITVSPAPSNVNAAAPVCTTNLMHAYFASASTAPSGVYPYQPVGAGAMLDPRQSIARGLQFVSSQAGDNAQTMTIRGYDIYGFPMTQVITMNGAGVVNTTRAFKYIASITASALLAGNLSIGTSDIYGFPLRSKMWEHMEIYMNGLQVTAASTGYVAAVDATPTNITGDVRGTYAVQTASNGTRRLVMYQTVPLFNMTAATPQNYASLYGQTQFTS